MAATVALQLRPKLRTAPNPTLIHFFSSSTSESGGDEQNNTSSPPSEPEPSFSAYFRDVKASLKQQSPRQHEPRKPFSLSSTTPSSPNSSRIASLDEIRKNLSEFRRRSAVPLPRDGPSSPPPPSQHISLQELYRRNVISKGEGPQTEINKGGTLSFDAIRESLRQLRSNAAKNQGDGGFKSNESMSLSKFKESFNLRPIDPSARESTVVIGDTHKLPSSVFGKEMKERNEAESAAMKTEFLKMYSYGELGEKLRQLRPEAKGENWFTLEELNQRLIKLREIEEKESDSSIGGVRFKDLRDSLRMLRISDEEKSKKSTCKCSLCELWDRCMREYLT